MKIRRLIVRRMAYAQQRFGGRGNVVYMAWRPSRSKLHIAGTPQEAVLQLRQHRPLDVGWY